MSIAASEDETVTKDAQMEGEGETGSEEPEQEQCPTPELDSSAAVFTMEGFYKSGSIKVRIPDGYQYTNFKYTVDGTEPSESNGALPSKAGNITASKIKAGVQDENGTVTIKVVAFADGKTTSEVATLQLTLAPADMVSFNDLKLKQAILTSLGRADEDAGKAVIRQTEMTEIKELDCSNQGITDLTGLENAVNLEKLNASGNDLSMTFDNYAGKLSADSYAALKEIDLSGCGIKMQAKNSNFLSRLFGAANLESVNLSSNKMYGCFTLNAQAALDKLSVLNLSGNDLYGIQITGNGTFDALDKIDMKQNRVYPDENGGDWYSSAIDFGIGRFDFSDQKNLTDLMDYRIYDGGYTTVDFDNEADVLDLGTLLDREVSLTLTGYGAYQTMSGNVEGRDLPVMIASPDNNRLCQFTLSLEPGENEFTIPLAHVNGEKRTITVRVKVQDVPSDEGEESAGIKDPVLQKNIIKELNARSEYKENPLDPSSHVITKEEIAKLTSLYIQGSGAGVLVRDMSGMENAVNLTNLVMSNIGEAEVDASKWTNMTDLRLGYNEGSIKKVKGLASMKNLTNLSISGEYEELEGLNEIAGGLTSITVSSKNLKTAPNLSAAVNLTSALISAAADGTLPDLSANKKLSTYSITDIRDGFSYQSDSVYESLSTVSVSAKNGQSFTLPEFKSEKSITYQLTGRGGSPLKVDISGIKNAATMVYNNTAGDTDLTLTGKSETLTSFKAENGAKVISFDRDFSAPGMTTMKIGSGNYATTDVVIESQDSFPALEDLKLWMVIHMNKIPAGVSGMSSLKNLELRWCYDLASIDDFDFSKMTSLETLTIASASGLKGTLNGSTIPSALKNLAISYTGLSAVSDNWTEMPNLKSLNLSLNKFGDFPTAAVKAAPNAESMDLSGNLYSTIPEDAFDNNIALKTLTLGNYLPGVAGGNMSFNGMPLSELLEGTTAAKAVSSLKERLPEVNVTIYGGPDLFSPSGSYSCLKSIGTSEGDVSADFINDRDLVLRVPAGTGSITLKPLAILEDTSITVNGKEYASGDEVTIDLPGMETEISIVCDNPYQKEFASSGSGFGEAAESKVEYTLKVIAASYIENFEPEDGHWYNVDYILKKADESTSMADGYFDHIALVKVDNNNAAGAYEIRFTTTSQDFISDMQYALTDGVYKKADVVAVKGNTATFRIFADNLTDPITVRPCVVPMGNVYVNCWMHLDKTKAIDMTASVGADKADLTAAITAAEGIISHVEESRNVYTTDSYTAMIEALDHARSVDALESPQQTGIDKAAKTLNDAIEALVIDESKLADTSELKRALEEAAAVEKGNHTDSAWNALKDAIADAQAVMDDPASSERDVARAIKSLNNAVTLFTNSGAASGLDAANLADGTYNANVTMINASNHAQTSMSDGAITKPITIQVKNGAYTAVVNFKGMSISLSGTKFYGYMKELSYWDGSAYKPVTVDSSYDLVDDYNDENGDKIADYKYPKQMSFPLLNKNQGDDEEGYVHVQVFVPIMEALSKGSGTQQALMKIDWTTLKKGGASADTDDKKPDGNTDTGSKTSGSGTGKTDTSKTGTAVQVGKTYTVDGQDYKVTKAASGSTVGTVTFTKAKNAKKITVPDTVKLADGKTYNVTVVGAKAFTAKKIRTVTVGANVSKLAKKAFAKSKAKKLILKTKSLKKASVKGSLKNSKVKKIQVKVGTKKVNKKFAKKYKKIFTKKNAGKKATVK